MLPGKTNHGGETMETINGIHEICVDKTSCKHKNSLKKNSMEEKSSNNISATEQEQNIQAKNSVPS